MTAGDLGKILRLLEEKRKAGAAHLAEPDALRVLEAAGIPVVPHAFAAGADEAAAFAASCGYPVVVKGILAAVAHKTEKGLVHPWVRSEAELRAVVKTLPAGCEGLLVQEHVAGIRELVVGVVRDPTFGPCVLAAMGGVHSELLSDTSFVLAPVEAGEARAALDRLRCAKMLGAYRGEAPARLDDLVDIMTRVGDLAVEIPAIRELDINPVILRRDGRPVACSGLVVL
jgi:succinyl-CoA synthetase beta subunit